MKNKLINKRPKLKMSHILFETQRQDFETGEQDVNEKKLNE